MKRPIPRRPSLRETLEANNKADAFLAAMAGVQPRGQAFVPEKRKYTKPSPDDSEAPVVAAVAEYLAVHPKVLFAVRQNSGALAYDKGGRSVPIWFYRAVRVPESMTIVDFWGFLRTGRPFAFEVKRPSWTGDVRREGREMKQRAFMNMIECIGGVGGFVRSVDDVERLLT